MLIQKPHLHLVLPRFCVYFYSSFVDEYRKRSMRGKVQGQNKSHGNVFLIAGLLDSSAFLDFVAVYM